MQSFLVVILFVFIIFPIIVTIAIATLIISFFRKRKKVSQEAKVAPVNRQNTEAIENLKSQNALLDAKLNEELNKTDPNIEILKSYKQEINNNNLEIERLNKEDDEKIEAAKATVVKKQPEWDKNNNGGAILYIGGILLIAGFCGILADSSLAALCIDGIAAFVFIIIALATRTSSDKQVQGVSAAALYVVETITPFIMFLLCEVANFNPYLTAAVASAGTFIVYLTVSAILKSNLSAGLAIFSSGVFAALSPGFLGLEGKFIYTAVALLLYSIIMSIVANHKNTPKQFAVPAKIMELTAVGIYTFAAFINIFSGTMHNYLRNVTSFDLLTYAIITVVGLVHLTLAFRYTKQKHYDIGRRVIGYFAIMNVLNVLTIGGSSTNLVQERALVGVSAAIICMIHSLFLVASARKKSTETSLEYETIIYAVFGFLAITSALWLDPSVRIFVAMAVTVAYYIGYYLCKKLTTPTSPISYADRANEIAVYATAYFAITIIGTILDGIGNNYDITMLKSVLSIHIVAGAAIFCGFAGKRPNRESIGVLILAVSMAIVALIDYDHSGARALPIYTLLHVIESVIIALIGFFAKDRGWMRVLGIISILIIIMTYTSEFLLLWFLLIGIALVIFAIYTVLKQKNK